MTTQAQALLRRQLRATNTLLRGLADDTRPGAVHAARVAVRKLRTVVGAIAPAMEPTACHRLRRGLKRIAAELGPVRDADVRCELLLPRLAQRDAGTRRGRDTRQALAGRLRTDRRNARRRLRATARSPEFAQRLRAMTALAGDGSLFVADTDADTLLTEALRNRLRGLRHAMRAGSHKAAQRHALRIRIKKCRYLLDARGTRPGSRSTARTRTLLHDLQDCLGDLNDLAQARRWLARQELTPAVTDALRADLQADEQHALSRLRRMRRELRRCDLKPLRSTGT